jgi:tRNA(adenine34) deaminase
VGSVLDVIRDRRPATGVEVVAGVRADESAALLRDFFVERRPSRPPEVTPGRG